MKLSRRQAIGGLFGLGLAGCAEFPTVGKGLRTRGVVLVPSDLSLKDWPERAAAAGLNTIALHHHGNPSEVVKFIKSPAGEDFLARCAKEKLEVEYELHAIRELLPRALFKTRPELFRTNEKGERTSDGNCCVHSSEAIAIICESAVKLSNDLRPTTGRYFLWGDDGRPWCECPLCKPFSNSDQAVILENKMVKALRKVHAGASLAHLAYAKTLPAPTKVKPDPNIFLEYAPIKRRHDIPYAEQTRPNDQDGLGALKENLKIFPARTAQALEYWLDVSRVSHWNRPAQQLPWNRDVFEKDLETYAALGVRNITTFAVWIDTDYVKKFGEPNFIREYGAGFKRPHAL